MAPKAPGGSVLDDLTSSFSSFSFGSLGASIAASSKAVAAKAGAGLLPPRSPTPYEGGAHDTIPAVRPNEAEKAAAREAADRRADTILVQLDGGYFEADADPLARELSKLTDDSKQEDIDNIVETLSAAVEVVSGKLARHVVKHQEKLLQGINNVTTVEDDLKAAYALTRDARAYLHGLADDVSRQIKVVGCTRRKQRAMAALEVAAKVKKAKDLQGMLKQAQEGGDYGEAILLCVDCFQGVESMTGLTVASELRATVQRLYYDTLTRLDAALLNVCTAFDPIAYSKLLEGYLLQGLEPAALGAKVSTCFQEAVSDAATSVVRSMVLTRPALVERLGSGDSMSFGELCRLLPPELVRPAVLKIMELSFELMGSFHWMAAWHAAGLESAAGRAAAATGARKRQARQQQRAAASTAAGSAASSSGDGSGSSSGSGGGEAAHAGEGPGAGADGDEVSQGQLEAMQAATRALLEGVATAMAATRPELWTAAASKVQEILSVPNLCKGEDFLQVVEWTQTFAAAGDAFEGRDSGVRAAFATALGGCLDAYHRSNIDALRACLATEHWLNVAGGSGGGAPVAATAAVAAAADAGAGVGVAALPNIEAALRLSPFQVPGWGQPCCVADFGEWLEGGNPFVRRATRKAQPAGGNSPTDATHQHPQQPRVATVSSRQVVRVLRAYCALMAALPERRGALWRLAADLYDSYLLATFILFSGVTLEQLVWDDDCLPHRLRSALVRICKREGCKYRVQVEELERTKPSKPVAPPAASLLDSLASTSGAGAGGVGGFSSSSTFGTAASTASSSTGSKFDMFTKKFKDTMVDLINTDLSAPMPPSGASSPTPYHQQGGGGGAGYGSPQALPRPDAPRSPQPIQQQPGVAGTAGARSPVPGGQPAAVGVATPQAAGSAHSGTYGGYSLRERVVAVEALLGIGNELKAARAALLSALNGAPGVGPKDVDSFLSRTVDAGQDLRDAVFKGGARQLMQCVLDPERGVAAAIAATSYALREPAARIQPWAEGLACALRGVHETLVGGGLPPDIRDQVWDHAVSTASEAMLEGFGRVRRCTPEGRAAMSLDLGTVDKALRQLNAAAAQQAAQQQQPASSPGDAGSAGGGGGGHSALRLVDGYVKAFYTPWDELPRWAQVHVAEYGRLRVLVLVEAIAEAYQIRKGARAAMMERLNAELAEFA